MSENIFQFLGLSANHRTGKKITQHVKHIDEIPESKKLWPMIGQVKKDGVYAMVVKLDNKTGIFSRAGKRYTNVLHLENRVAGYGTDEMATAVYIAELCCDRCSLETLSGIVNPNRKKVLSEEQEALVPHMYLSFHDAISIQDFINGYSKFSYRERYSWLCNHLAREFDILENSLIMNDEHATEFARYHINDEEEEGVVFKQYDAKMSDWQAGHKGYRMMKKVRGVDYDLLCTGAEEGTGKYKGLVANLFFKWKDGKEIKCMLGKGWTHDNARDMWLEYSTPHRDNPVGKIFQVYALQESSKGKLRLPKVGELRHDKDYSDIEEDK